MSKFFKKFIPCAVLSACVASSVVAISACGTEKDYSEDFKKLQQQIDDQKQEINNQKQEIEDLKNENNSLKDQISSITPDDKDYTEEIQNLQQQIESLKTQNDNYLEESAKLKQQIEDLKNDNGNNIAEINRLEQQLETLKTQNENNLAEISRLEQQIEELRQNSTTPQLKTYKIGETFTYNYYDTYIFSIKLETRTKLIIKNINSPAPLQLNDFIQIQRIGTVEGLPTSGIITFENTTLKKGSEHVKNLSGSISEHHTTLFFGIPLSDKSIFPYAIFDLTSSI